MDYPVLTPVSSLTAFHYFMCAFAHFCQNICAFTVLSIVTPVTYSIGGLVKRIVVIGSSIVILGDNIGFVQGLGIVLTFLGVGMYDRFKLDLKQGRENNILPIVR